MNKLILNFKSKDSKNIKNPKNFLGGKGANLSETVSYTHLTLPTILLV